VILLPAWCWDALCGCLVALGLIATWWLATDPNNRKDRS
jgi:hypothetical protein